MAGLRIGLDAPIFRLPELCDIAGISAGTAGNWIARAIIRQTADSYGRPAFTLNDLIRTAIIASLVQHVGVPPAKAADLADMAMRELHLKILDRDEHEQLRSRAHLYLIFRFGDDGGQFVPVFRRPGELAGFDRDPYRHPDAKPADVPAFAHGTIPISLIADDVVTRAAAILNAEGGRHA